MKLLLVFLTFASSVWAGPIIVGSGEGSAEFYVYYAQKSAERTLSFCLSNSACSKGITPALNELLAEKPYNSRILISPQTDTGPVDFVTQTLPGADIRLNQDRLWKGDQAFGYQDVFDRLITAWLDQLKWPTTTVDAMIANLAPFLSSSSTRAPWPGGGLTTLALVQFDVDPDLLFLEDDSNVSGAMSRDLSLSSTFDCHSSTGVSAAPKVTATANFRWLQTVTKSAQLFATAIGRISYACPDGKNSSAKLTADLILYLPIAAKNQRYIFREGDVSAVIQNIK
jgi:hypothetical protein